LNHCSKSCHPRWAAVKRPWPGLLAAAWALGVAVALGACGEERPAAPPPAAAHPGGVGVGPLVVAWESSGASRRRVLVGTAGVASGTAGGPLALYLYVSPERAADVRFLRRAFAPFETAAPSGGRLRFAGAGPARASAAERRMIAEWTRMAAAESTGGPGEAGAAYELALAWHRGGGTGGGCDDVVVYLTGEARASSCGWGEELRGRLSREALERLYGWFDRYRPFQQATTGEGPAGELPARLIFAGQGAAEAPAAERAAMEAFAAALHRELAARRRPPPGGEQAPAGSEPAPAPRPAAATTPPPPAAHLLRPPDAASRPAQVVVPEWALPKKPPPLPPP
jgi:hypothetical protein